MSILKPVATKSNAERHSQWPGVLILALHLAGAGAWWWLMPGGFPVNHPRFWVNQALPLGVLLAGLAGFAAWRWNWHAPWLALLYAAPAGWIGAAISFRIAFPVSSRGWWVLLIWAAWLLSVVRRGNPGAWFPNRRVMIPALMAACVGALIPWSQRGPAPSTAPANEQLPDMPPAAGGERVELPVTLDGDVQVVPRDGSVKVRLNKVSVVIQPLLTFISRSPDRCWSALAPRADREPVPRKLVAGHFAGSAVWIKHASDVSSVLRVSVPSGRRRAIASQQAPGPVSIDAFCQLDRPVYSHLNSFCEFEVSGFQSLELSFSPCPDTPIEVTVSDYPVGRPRRVAFLDADGLFQIVETASGEKGPFRRLAAGPLPKSAPLTITLHDRGRSLCRITLDDWSSQVSTDLSPTAGWGLPMNAIEFARYDESTPGAAVIWVTLAGTSVGRGFDTVGHAAGVYRNRIRIER